jgi:hypothetical protein
MWTAIVIGAAVVAAITGFVVGRAAAPNERRVREMERERDAARAEAEKVRGEVDRHFEESARMFGRLADEYRSFFEHFAQTAQNLGMSEGRARSLLQRANPRLSEPADSGRGDAATESGRSAAAASSAGAVSASATSAGSPPDAGAEERTESRSAPDPRQFAAPTTADPVADAEAGAPAGPAESAGVEPAEGQAADAGETRPRETAPEEAPAQQEPETEAARAAGDAEKQTGGREGRPA